MTFFHRRENWVREWSWSIDSYINCCWEQSAFCLLAPALVPHQTAISIPTQVSNDWFPAMVRDRLSRAVTRCAVNVSICHRRKTPFSDLPLPLNKSVHGKASGGSVWVTSPTHQGPGSGHSWCSEALLECTRNCAPFTWGHTGRDWGLPSPDPRREKKYWWMVISEESLFQNFLLRVRDTKHSAHTCLKWRLQKWNSFWKIYNKNYALSKAKFSGVCSVEHFHIAFTRILCVCGGKGGKSMLE